MASLEAGTMAPEIKSKDQDGKPFSLSSLLGHKVALYFYPKDDTPGCTKEACNLRDNYDKLLKAGYSVVGVSVDDEKSHTKFRTKYNLPFPLLADTDHSIVEAYGVWVEKNMYGKKYMGTNRVTYLIDEKGVITHVFNKVNTEAHAEEILALK